MDFSEVDIIVRRLIREGVDSLPLGGTTPPPTLAYWQKLLRQAVSATYGNA